MTSSDPNAAVEPRDVEAIVAFLPRLEALIPDRIWSKKPQITVHEPEKEIWIERGEYDPAIHEFQRALYDHGCIRDYDWMAWQPHAVRLFKNPGLLAKAQMKTCIKLLTLHVRRERFDDGHLAVMLRAGHITAILRRMGELSSHRSTPFPCCILSSRQKLGIEEADPVNRTDKRGESQPDSGAGCTLQLLISV